MQDIPLPSGRPLTETERWAYMRLGLTPGHLAALVAAPFVVRRGRGVLFRTRADIDQLEILRLELRTVRAMSDEAARFWERVIQGLEPAEGELAQRLLAWHLATDLSHAGRAAFLQRFRRTVDYLTARSAGPLSDPDAITWDLLHRTDQYLPIASFTRDDPGRIEVARPTTTVLGAVARRIAPMRLAWSALSSSRVVEHLPVTVRLLGEPVGEWWYKDHAPRRAAERGLASERLAERERYYADMQREWQELFQRWSGARQARECAARFVGAVREWVDGVRFAARRPDLWGESPQPNPESLEPMTAPIVVAPPPVPRALPVARPVSPVVPAPIGDPARELISGGRSGGTREIHPIHINIVSPPPPPEPAPVPARELVPVPTREPAHDPSIPADSVRMPSSIRHPPVPPPVPPVPPPKPKPERVTARLAAPFKMVGLDDALARARATSVADVCAWLDGATPLLFDDCRDVNSREVAVVRMETAVPTALWVVGDLHADVLSLANVIAHADAQAAPEAPAHFLFLGDFVDRGIHDHETLLLLFGLMMAHPERVCVIPGNHDVDLEFDATAGRFRVTIEPAEYCESLNAALARDHPTDRERVALARAFIRFCAGRPKAVFLPDGTMFAHGGFPHTDAQKDLAALPDLCKKKCLDDFLWARIAESARVKRPNRGSRGHEFGWDTLAQFARIATEKLDLQVKRFVRGHDHVGDRWMEYPEYADNFVPVLTINAMGRLLDGEPARRDGHPHPLPVVGRFVPNHLPEVIALPLDPAEVDRAFRRSRQEPPEAPPAPVPIGETIDALLRSRQPEPAAPRERDAIEEPKPEGREPGAEAVP